MTPLIASPRIAIVGTGAVGCYYGGRLALPGARGHFPLRSDQGGLRVPGLRLHSPERSLPLEKVKG